MSKKVALGQALAVTNEVCGGDELPKAVFRIYIDELSHYDPDQVSMALSRCARECRGTLALADIISRIADGWPDPQEAWALCPRGEGDTVVWTDEIAEAFEAVRGHSDRVAARMSFLEIYRKRLDQARADHRVPRWWASLGHDQAAQRGPLLEAVRRGRLAPTAVQRLLPDATVYLPETLPVGQLPAAEVTDEEQAELDELIATARQRMGLPARED